jgi:hypothetical protein
LLQLGERVKIIVQPAPYQQSRVSVFRWHRVQLFYHLLTSNKPVDDTFLRATCATLRPPVSARSRALACGPRAGRKRTPTSRADPPVPLLLA